MIDIEQWNGKLKISYFNKEGKVEFKSIPIPRAELYKWEPAGPERKDPFFQSWDGKPVKRTPQNWLNRYRIEEFLMSLGEDYLKELYTFNKPEMWFCDIEVEVGDDFPDPAQAEMAVTTVALCNAKGQTYVLGRKPLDGQQIASIEQRLKKHFAPRIQDVTLEYFYFESEAELLFTLMTKWFKQAPLLTGWNFVDFDWKYLVNRCRRLGIDPANASLSKKLRGKEDIPMHKIVVDYMNIYKKWDKVVKIKDNNKLDTVAQQSLGIQKVKYAGTIMDMYNDDFETYVMYNAVDTLLVKLIHDEIDTMQTFLMLGNVTRVESLKAFSPIWMTESLLIREFFKVKRVVADVKKSNTRGSFEGAYVKDPIKGLHEILAAFDFASLYPKTMMQWNISVESFLGKGIDIPADKEWVRTASGAVFDNSFESVVKKLLVEYYGKRKKYKNNAFEIEKELDVLQKVRKTK